MQGSPFKLGQNEKAGEDKKIQDNQVLLQHCEENLEVDQNREKANQLRRELNTQLKEEEL